MKKDEIQKLVQIRTDAIKFFNYLDAKNEPTGVIKQAEVARELEGLINKLDAVLKNHVSFS